MLSKPDYVLKVTINGKRVNGFMELAQMFPDADPDVEERQVRFENDFDAAIIPVRRGERIKNKIELV